MSGLSVRGALIGCLMLQAAVGAAVVASSVEGLRLPGGPRLAPLDPAAPVRPDDQTRRYRPADWTAPPGAPGLPASGPMPDRLNAEITDGVLRLWGRIDPDAAGRVADMLDTAPEPPARVTLDSPGGAVDAALAIGRDLRARDLVTSVGDRAICLSACPYMLAGGVEREVSEGARVGVHQSYYDSATYLPLFIGVSSVQQGEAEAMRFLLEMGVDPLLRIPALETPPDAIYLLTRDELLDYRLATAIDG